ncbi:PepSY-associated TM helix domain-containing protein [Janthinobacterium psychrotolerans]|uniref:Putative iron-regulated membrane protein n=1 Tax=Janthinobacterium psychrotolerans TaxID=1747903 RepID=A0A1A7C2S8_9BURK|nr:PepSY-associated TM helix domain-containing protein [Janthinobacterium psychrotolerans]OBV40037.1 putative iron-regulated membrane protein [Janthinobacterium psychrotolerans]
MKDGLRQSMAWLHTWVGLTCGWLLCAIFFTGTLSVFREPITRWMAAPPVLAGTMSDAVAGTPLALDAAVRHLSTTAPKASFWRLELPAQPGDALALAWRNGKSSQQAALHPATGELLPAPWGRKTEGGRHFMSFHYTLHGGTAGYWLVGWIAMCALAALVSGVIVHRRIFADFFTFRPRKGQRSWLDAHNASAVFTLPFSLMIVYTGVAFFHTSYMPWPLQTAYGGDDPYAGYQQELAHGAAAPIVRKRSGTPAPLLPLAPMLASAEQLLGKPATMVLVQQPGDSQATVRVFANEEAGSHTTTIVPAQGLVIFDGVTGAVLQVTRPEPPATLSTGQVHHVIEALHLARFGGWPMKCLYFISGLLGTVMVATGANLFMVKRRRKSELEFGAATAGFYRVVEAFSVASMAGICIASIGYLWINRLLPAELAQRDTWEIRAFLWLWGATLLHALARPPGRAWVEQFAFAALLCLALPLLNQCTTGQQLWRYAMAGDAMRAGVELTALALGVVFACCAWRIHRVWQARAVIKPVQRAARA